MTSGKLIIAVYASVIYISCKCLSSCLEYNSVFVGLGVWGVWGSQHEIWLFKSVGDNADGLSTYSVVQVGNGGMPEMITNDSETF